MYYLVIDYSPPLGMTFFLTIVLLAIFLHVDLEIAFDWFTVGLTI